MKNLFFGMVAILLSIMIVSCSQSELNQIDEKFSQEELIELRTALENSDELKALRANNAAFEEELRAGKVELFELFDEINTEGISFDCKSLDTHESRLKGLDIFKSYVCDYNDLKLAMEQKFEVLSELNEKELRFVFGHEIVSRDFDCYDVLFVSLEFYDIETSIWAFYECCKDELFIGCL